MQWQPCGCGPHTCENGAIDERRKLVRRPECDRRSGQATVRLIRKRSTGELFAGKFLREHWDEFARAAFKNEGLRQARLMGPGVVRVYDYNFDAPEPFIVLQYMPRGSLAKELAARRRIPLLEALQITQEIARLLSHLHAKNVVHRDVKPGNVLRGTDGQLLLNDFGLGATMSIGEYVTAGGFVGTRPYAAPEQSANFAVPTSDVYPLGVMLAEMLTGSPVLVGTVRRELSAYRTNTGTIVVVFPDLAALERPSTTGQHQCVPTRSWLPKGDHAANMRTAIQWLITNTKPGQTALLVVHGLSNAEPHSIIGGIVGQENAKALKADETVSIGAGQLRLVTLKRPAPAGWAGGPVLVAWAKQDALDLVDKLHGATSVLAVTWADDADLAQWVDTWNVARLGATPALAARLVTSPVVENALRDIVGTINVADGGTHPSDKAAIVQAFRILRDAGERIEPARSVPGSSPKRTSPQRTLLGSQRLRKSSGLAGRFVRLTSSRTGGKTSSSPGADESREVSSNLTHRRRHSVAPLHERSRRQPQYAAIRRRTQRLLCHDDRRRY